MHAQDDQKYVGQTGQPRLCSRSTSRVPKPKEKRHQNEGSWKPQGSQIFPQSSKAIEQINDIPSKSSSKSFMDIIEDPSKMQEAIQQLKTFA
ncbi:hypothetical protein EBT16_09085, partial [bacterium]|nr:hypothetical protein [bacterium]